MFDELLLPFVALVVLLQLLMLLSDGDVVVFVRDELFIFWFDDIPIIYIDRNVNFSLVFKNIGLHVIVHNNGGTILVQFEDSLATLS
jgi:hypothetical protein